MIIIGFAELYARSNWYTKLIIRPFFEGDDLEVATQQSFVYENAMRTIIANCNRHTVNAQALLKDMIHTKWEKIESFDPRPLEYCHDVLAAVWRFGNDFSDIDRDLFGNRVLGDVQPLWLDWLYDETNKWHAAPYFVRSIQLIVTNLHEPIGHLAKLRLHHELVIHYSQVPWDDNLFNRIETKYYSYAKKLRNELHVESKNSLEDRKTS